jgi:L-rhamnose-H+ transport protein
MGLILSLGALIPLLLQSPGDLVSWAGLLLLAGTAVTVGGIVLCSQGAAAKEAQSSGDQLSQDQTGGRRARPGLGAGLVIAILAGVFSCFPNVGMNHAEGLKAAAVEVGASKEMAGNAAWALLFTAGFVLNFGYCLFLMISRGRLSAIARHFAGNTAWIAAMSAMWIGSFYLYGMGAARMGSWGGILGWPLFIALAILVGNLWGLWRGEWRNAGASARGRLNRGLLVLLAAVVIFGLASAESQKVRGSQLPPPAQGQPALLDIASTNSTKLKEFPIPLPPKHEMPMR